MDRTPPPAVALFTSTLGTPAGPLALVVDPDGAVRAAGFTDAATLLARLRAPDATERADLGDASRAVHAYVDGDLGALDGVPVVQRGTAFQAAVWDALRQIPPGRTAAYGELAAQVGRPTASRAVGAACGRNLVAPFIPCHRAVRSDGGHGGYEYGLAAKDWLLRHERAALV